MIAFITRVFVPAQGIIVNAVANNDLFLSYY
jgi:hypothetical protein